MTEGDDKATWLPNLVSGVSIWKLAVDLNEAKFFDGRLLVPETEGSESLPVTVRWDLTGLTPLAEARAKQPEGTAAAIADFKACLDRVAKVFSTPNSGFDKFKEAFTVPSMEADGGASYFYSPEKKKLFVVNWGASPRSMGGKAEYVFGYEDWARAFKGKGAPSSPAAMAADAAAGGAAVADAGAAAATKKDEAKAEDDEKKRKQEEKKRAWWLWPLLALVAIALVLLALLLLRSCEEPNTIPAADAAADALADAGAVTDAAAAADAEAGAEADAGKDAAADAADADAGADASADAGADAGKDGGLATNDDDDDGPGSSGGSSGGTGKVVVTVGPAAGTAGAKAGPHRRHYQREAVNWRVVSGNDKIARTELRGRRFDVWLGAGRSFEGVRVEWQNASGKWHVH